ncbi:aromatic motif membrane protein [Mycoplasmopsis arginini]|uniref:aromatic motif membrane protein n=1 Tax=Mycoplasmopsis arginini TaxID=2094 RepID=UPI003D0916EA
MKKKQKFIFLTSVLPFSMLPIAAVSCQNPNNNLNESKLSNIIKNNNKESKWDVFLKYEYVNSLLNLAFKNDNDKRAFIEKQKNISESYLTTVKEYLLYSNNVVAMYGSNDGFFSNNKVIGLKEFRAELDKLFKENWLWFLFNLDRFTFALYNSFDQFQGTLESLSQDIQKNSLDLSSFNRPTTNEVLQFVVHENKTEDNLEYEVHLLTKQGIILKITINTNLKDDDDNPIPEENQKSDVSIFTYSYIYPSLFQNDVMLQKFDLSKYVRAMTLWSTSSSERWVKILFDEEYGGTPLRFTIVYVDDKKAA